MQLRLNEVSYFTVDAGSVPHVDMMLKYPFICKVLYVMILLALTMPGYQLINDYFFWCWYYKLIFLIYSE